MVQQCLKTSIGNFYVGYIEIYPSNGTFIDGENGTVSGFHFDRGNLQQEFYGAFIEDSKCAKKTDFVFLDHTDLKKLMTRS